MRDRLIAGDDGALEDLYDQYGSLVYGLAMRVTRHEAVAEAVTVDVLALFTTDPTAFDPGETSLRAWLARQTHRLAVDRVRGSE